MIEGNLSDLQFCASKIYSYCENQGYAVQRVHITPLGENTFINIEILDPDERLIRGRENINGHDIVAIMLAGYMRAEMMMAAFYPKH